MIWGKPAAVFRGRELKEGRQGRKKDVAFLPSSTAAGTKPDPRGTGRGMLRGPVGEAEKKRRSEDQVDEEGIEQLGPKIMGGKTGTSKPGGKEKRQGKEVTVGGRRTMRRNRRKKGRYRGKSH